MKTRLVSCPNGGSLKVSTDLILRRDRGAKGARLAPGRKTYVRLTFADTGPGVPPELKEKIFTPFYTSRVKGMGLGLSIVKGIVDAHHGVLRETGETERRRKFRDLLTNVDFLDT